MSDTDPGNTVKAGVLVTGTEVLTATIRDENGPWLSEQLLKLGIELVEIMVMADHRTDLLAGLRHMADLGIELIITTGGLGPTADDLTAEVVAEFTGRPLRLDEAMEARIADILARYAASASMTRDREAMRAANRASADVAGRSRGADAAFGSRPGCPAAFLPAADVRHSGVRTGFDSADRPGRRRRPRFARGDYVSAARRGGDRRALPRAERGDRGKAARRAV
jgi:nicotinamide-nucleotide amidase